MEQKPFFTEEGAAEYLGLQSSTLRTMRCHKDITYYKAATGRVYYKRTDLDNYALARRIPSRHEVEAQAELKALDK